MLSYFSKVLLVAFASGKKSPMAATAANIYPHFGISLIMVCVHLPLRPIPLLLLILECFACRKSTPIHILYFPLVVSVDCTGHGWSPHSMAKRDFKVRRNGVTGGDEAQMVKATSMPKETTRQSFLRTMTLLAISHRETYRYAFSTWYLRKKTA